MSIYKVCRMWAKTIADGGDEMASKRYSNCNVYFIGRTIYSYGGHFPMAYVLAPNVVWFNGDRFSPSTNRHQRELRSAIASAAPNATVVIVPRSSLDGARADYRTIVPVDVHGERWEYTERSGAETPADMVTDNPHRYGYSSYGGESHYNHAAPGNVVGYVNRDGSCEQVRLIDGVYRWHDARHWLGDSVFTAERVTGWSAETGNVRERVPFISSFDKQERRPLYFLSQLPRTVDTVDAAIDALAPESVHTARDIGRNVVRQGDMFAIEMNVSTRQLKAAGATITKRTVSVDMVNHAVESSAVRVALEWITEHLPRPVREYGSSELYDAWRAADDEWKETVCRRYAALFPNMPHIHRYSLDGALTYQPRRPWDYRRSVEASALYGTAHTASEVATLPDGRQYARGTMYHDPAVIGERRNADHARQALGKRWHLIARNTVPVSGAGSGRRLEAGRSLTAA